MLFLELPIASYVHDITMLVSTDNLSWAWYNINKEDCKNGCVMSNMHVYNG